ncbi:hypothetical protein AB1Y20_018512 [Prymnesium parvum]|uniref:DET1- and DDB1-associated protein 1 domain-containing protein n=1 Tax=Prymnesium parvum TaxID=97485 RepID=A0AB34JS58_PRYPA
MEALANLPSRRPDSFSLARSQLHSTRTSPNATGGVRVYYATHNTQPPDDQVITTEKTNILLRQFQQRAEARAQQQKRSAREMVQGSTAEDGRESRRPRLEGASTAQGKARV